jgi:hypothetical protein
MQIDAPGCIERTLSANDDCLNATAYRRARDDLQTAVCLFATSRAYLPSERLRPFGFPIFSSATAESQRPPRDSFLTKRSQVRNPGRG